MTLACELPRPRSASSITPRRTPPQYSCNRALIQEAVPTPIVYRVLTLMTTIMSAYVCQCGSPLFFSNFNCLKCQSVVGRCESCRGLSSFTATDESFFQCDLCGANVTPCSGRENSICNVFSTRVSANCLCGYCNLTTRVPDLSTDENQVALRRLEAAKRRLLIQLQELHLPPFCLQPEINHVLTFEFLQDEQTPSGLIRHLTGHLDGKIVINVSEADSRHREHLRVQFGEPQRTLIGHFRHEIGHYLEHCFRRHKLFSDFSDVFGDPNQVAYEVARQNYYATGGDPNWEAKFPSEYASMHPSEDFAETVNLYLDITSIANTAAEFDIEVIDYSTNKSVFEFVPAVLNLAVIITEFNFDMGLSALLPESINDSVMRKLQFVHSLRRASE